MSSIWGARMPDGAACTKIPYKGYEISIAMDDSCGAMIDYGRSGICVFKDGVAMTHLFGAPHCFSQLPADAETLKATFDRIDAMERA